MKKSPTPADEKETLRKSVQSFHQCFVDKLLNKWEERCTDSDKKLKRQEIEKRWRDKLGKMIPSSLIEEQLQEPPEKCTVNFQRIPSESTATHPLLAPIQETVGTITHGVPQSKIATSLPSTFKLRRLPQQISAETAKASAKRSDNAPEPASKRRKVDPKSSLAAKVVGTGTEALLAGMKVFVHRPSLDLSQTSFNDKYHREDIEKDIAEMRIVTIHRENIQTASKFITRTKLLLRESNGTEATIVWPSHAAYIDKDILCQHILEAIQFSQEDLPRLSTAVDPQGTEADRSSSAAFRID